MSLDQTEWSLVRRRSSLLAGRLVGLSLMHWAAGSARRSAVPGAYSTTPVTDGADPEEVVLDALGLRHSGERVLGSRDDRQQPVLAEGVAGDQRLPAARGRQNLVAIFKNGNANWLACVCR